MCRYLNNERGSAIAMLLLITVVLLILGTGLITNSITEQRIARQQELGTSLYYVAEAGLEEAIAVKIKDFDFQDELNNPCGKGSYSVVITPETDFKHRIVSTGELEGKTLNLGAIIELRDLYKKAVLVSKDLTIEKTTINGDLHCNNNLSIKGPDNKLLPTAGLPGSLTYSCPDNKINWEGAESGDGCIQVQGECYSKDKPFPEDWCIDSIPLPEIDLDQILGQHTFTKKSNNKEWREAPDYGKVLDQDGKERQYIHIGGNLTICPGPGEQFIFDGILVVDGDVEIKGSGAINFEGMIVTEKDLFVKNAVNVGLTGKVVVLAADKDVKVFGDQNECTENPVFGGDLLLFSKGGQVTIGHQKMKGEQFIMHGIIFANKTVIYNCNLTYITELSDMRQRYFPAYGLVVTAWFQP